MSNNIKFESNKARYAHETRTRTTPKARTIYFQSISKKPLSRDINLQIHYALSMGKKSHFNRKIIKIFIFIFIFKLHKQF